MKILRSRLTLCILLLLLIFLMGCLVATRVLEGKIRAELSSIKESGAPVTLSQIIPPPLSPSVNGAPLYYAAIDLVDIDEFKVIPGLLTRRSRLASFRELLSLYRQNKEGVRELLERNSIPLQLLSEGAKRNGCRYDLRYEEGMAMRVLNYPRIRNLNRLSVLKALDQVEEKKLADAAQTIAVALRFTRTLQPESSIMNHAVKLACRDDLLHVLNLLIEAGYRRGSPVLLEEVRKISREVHNELLQACYGERAMGTELFQGHSKDAERILGEDLKKPLFFYLETKLPGKPLLLYDELYYLRLWRQVISSFQKGEVPSISSLPESCVITSFIMPNSSRLVIQNRKTAEDYRIAERRLNP